MFWYGLRNRPAGPGTCPRDVAEFGKHPKFRHGTVGYTRRLTDGEVYSFELSLILHGDMVDEAARKLVDGMGEYRDQYADEANADVLDDYVRNEAAAHGYAQHDVMVAAVLAELRQPPACVEEFGTVQELLFQ